VEQAPQLSLLVQWRPLPYVTYLTLRKYLDWLKTMGALPESVDPAAWTSSALEASKLRVAMRGLGLLTSTNAPDRQLLELLAMSRNDQDVALYRILERDFAWLWKLPKNVPADEIMRILMREGGASASTVGKCRSFITATCKAAGKKSPVGRLQRTLDLSSRERLGHGIQPQDLSAVDEGAPGNHQIRSQPNALVGPDARIQAQTDAMIEIAKLQARSRKGVDPMILDHLRFLAQLDAPANSGKPRPASRDSR